MIQFKQILLLVVALAACIAVCTSLTAQDVEGVVKDDKGEYFITHDGIQWQVIDDEEGARPYFYNAETGSQWEDPRAEIEDDDEDYAQRPESSMPDFDDVLEYELPDPSTVVKSLLAVVLVPMFLVGFGLAARIWYLQKFYPELLFPTKERKQRRQKSSKLKPQKARGKMSQDGKGGRSANS